MPEVAPPNTPLAPDRGRRARPPLTIEISPRLPLRVLLGLSLLSVCVVAHAPDHACAPALRVRFLPRARLTRLFCSRPRSSCARSLGARSSRVCSWRVRSWRVCSLRASVFSCARSLRVCFARVRSLRVPLFARHALPAFFFLPVCFDVLKGYDLPPLDGKQQATLARALQAHSVRRGLTKRSVVGGASPCRDGNGGGGNDGGDVGTAGTGFQTIRLETECNRGRGGNDTCGHGEGRV